MEKRIHFTTSSGSDQNGEWHASSACGLNEDSDADWNGSGSRDKVTCKRCLTQMAKPRKISPIGFHKEHPILFSGPMVRAILEGRKTVTRRPLKGHQIPRQIGSDDEDLRWMSTVQNHPRWGIGAFGATEAECVAELAMYGGCPYGNRGDRLWVREAWARVGIAQAPDQEWVVYRECDNRTDYGGPWKPSIHMFRRDSRILLEITNVRVERLQDISDEQAEAEGVDFLRAAPDLDETLTAAQLFGCLWSSINGAESWDANPWVWVVEFERVTP